MPLTFIYPPKPYVAPVVPRCPIDGAPYDAVEGVYTCSFLHGRQTVIVIGEPR